MTVDPRFYIVLVKPDRTRQPVGSKANLDGAIRAAETFAALSDQPYVVVGPDGSIVYRAALPMPVDGTDTEWAKAVQFQTAAYPYPEDLT